MSLNNNSTKLKQFSCPRVQPFPVGYQKGWKINSFIHGHRVWFHFLTFTQSPTAPCIKVYAAFDKINASAQVQ